MRHLLHQSVGQKGQFGHSSPLKQTVQEAKDDEEDEGNNSAGFELEHGEIASGVLEGGFDAVDFLEGFGGFGIGGGFHGFELLGGFVDGGFEGVVGGGAVDEDPGDAFAEDGGDHGDSDHC